MSLPSVYDPNKIIHKIGNEIKAPMSSIMEESTVNNITAETDELDMSSLPPSEVYFLKKEVIPVVFSDAKSVTDLKENDEYLNSKKPMNDTFTVTNEPILTIKQVKEKEEIIKNENKKIVNEIQKSSSERNSNNKLNFVKDQKDTDSIKKWQDAMKTRWLQNILIEGEPKDISNNQITVNGRLQINTSSNTENKTQSEILNSTSNMESDRNSSSVTQNELEEYKNNKIYENIVKNTYEHVPKLLVTPESLSETLERLQSTHSVNQDNVHNNRNLVFSTENLNKINNTTISDKTNNDFTKEKTENDNTKLEISLDDKLNSNRNGSRHSSITDSLQEFESSIYDMLQQSARENISDEDDSLVIMNAKNNNNNSMTKNRIETPQLC